MIALHVLLLTIINAGLLYLGLFGALRLMAVVADVFGGNKSEFGPMVFIIPLIAIAAAVVVAAVSIALGFLAMRKFLPSVLGQAILDRFTSKFIISVILAVTFVVAYLLFA